MRGKIILVVTILLSFSQLLNAQNGTIRGTVFDSNNGEFLFGVTILAEGTTTGTITDFDGKFNLSIAPGTYSLRISFISYQTINLSDVVVKPGETTVLDDIGLKEATVDINEVTVTAKRLRDTETALFAIKRKSPNLLDGISATNLRKIGDSDAASSMKRISGVSVEGGKYVYVRGLGDRYTKTILNGVDIPGLDPDRNSLQMDIFPTNIIDNIIVHKSFSADLPADFTGGIIDIALKDFPEEKTGKVSASTTYNPNFHFKSNYLTYEGGSTDWLGFDDGTRAIPATNNIPEFAHTFTDAAKKTRYLEILNNFNTTMGTLNKTSFVDFSLGASFGNQVNIRKVSLGYNVAISYKNNTEFYEDAEDGRWGLDSDASENEMDRREHQIGDYGVNNSLLSGLAGFTLKTEKSKYRLNYLHLQNAEAKAGVFNFTGSDQGSDFTSKQHNIDFSQRSISNALLSGNHNFNEQRWEIEWKLSPTLSKLNDPDVRFTRFETRGTQPTIGTEVGFPERIWRELEEINMAGLAHFTKEFDAFGEKSKIKFGGAYTFKERDFSIRKFLLNIRGGDGELPLTGDPNQLLTEEIMWPYNGNLNYGTTFETDFSESNKYNAKVNYMAGFASSDLTFSKKLKTTIGLRVEKFEQNYTGQNQQATKVLNNDLVLDDLDLFPTVNFVYSLDEMQNVRVSYSKTIARPSIKEVSYAEIYDPISGRTFIGGLHTDINDQGDADSSNDIVYWDGNLKSSDIHNFDLRWEKYFKYGQMVSFSAFYKKFINPIEMVQYTTQTGAFQPRNVGDGQILGAETEFRFNLGFINDDFRNFKLSSNITITDSRIEYSATELESRLANARSGEEIEEYRDMAGQAPFIINTGIAYNGAEEGFAEGLEAGLYYNVQGKTLQYVGIVDRPDIYTKPFHSLNFNANKKFGENDRMSFGVKVSNILKDKKESVYQSYEANDQLFSSLAPGMSIRFSFSYRFL